VPAINRVVGFPVRNYKFLASPLVPAVQGESEITIFLDQRGGIFGTVELRIEETLPLTVPEAGAVVRREYVNLNGWMLERFSNIGYV
jgi:hypothetical protein